MSRVSEDLANTTVADVVTTAATNSSPYGYSEAQANAIVAQLNSLLQACRDAGILKSS